MSQIKHRQRLQSRQDRRAEDHAPLTFTAGHANPEIFQAPEQAAITIPPANAPGPVVTKPTAATVVPLGQAPPAPKIHTEASSIQISPGGAALTGGPPAPPRNEPKTNVEGDGFRLDPADFVN